MPNNISTKFQRLTDVIVRKGNPGQTMRVTNYSLGSPMVTTKANPSPVLYTSNSKEDAQKRLLQMKQQKLLSYQWVKSGYDVSMEQMAGANQVRIMYRDCDLMDAWPEIGTALDIISEECTTPNKEGKILNIRSKSERVVSVLEDLFTNRLDIKVILPMIFRSMAKYGNEYMFLNIDEKDGIEGWRELPVHEMLRVENGMMNAYSGNYVPSATNLKNGETKFIWEGHNEQTPYKSWQVAHFRLITDSLYLPYGVSICNKGRRAWRMMSMMEDGMLIYRMERSISRRIFKVNVGLIDDADVPAFLQDFMNNVKRAPMIDPQTGMVDLRKNFLDVSADYVIPVRNQQDPTSIDTLDPAKNDTNMDDMNYMLGKVLCAMRVPKSYLNFEEAEGKGQNLSLLDIRFARMINRLQQAVIMELNKIAIIHLFLLGFEDDLTNFTITMNNPSNQIEVMQLDNDQKKLNNAQMALQETGSGLPIMSWHQVQREIMGRTDKEILDMLQDFRFEAAIAAELPKTPQIIPKTNIFKKTDRIYGDPDKQYTMQPDQNGMGGLGGGGGLGGALGGGMGGGDLLGSLGAPDDEGGGDIGGAEGSEDLSAMRGDNSGAENAGGGQPLMESRRMSLINRIDEYIKHLSKNIEGNDDYPTERPAIYNRSALLINEDIDSKIKSLEKIHTTKILDD